MPDPELDPQRLRRLTDPLLADPVIAATPVAEIRRRASRRSRQRAGALAVVVVALLAVGGTALARAGREAPVVRVGTTPGTDQTQPDIQISLNPTITPQQTAAIQGIVLADPDVVSAAYSDQAATYAQFRCFFRDQPDLAESVQPGAIPARFSVDIAGGQTEVDQLTARLSAVGGIHSVSVRPPYVTHSTGPTLSIPPGAAVATMTLTLTLTAPAYTVQPYPGGCPLTGTTIR